MGEVYRARDTNLARDVAVKVLPDAFALDPDRLARFRREAQVLASLNHPHIAAIYGLEESSKGACGLVLELGRRADAGRSARARRRCRSTTRMADRAPDLRRRSKRLTITGSCTAISSRRTSKCAPDGTVKVLDFGLAKAFDPATDLV